MSDKKALLVIDMQNDYLWDKRKSMFLYDTAMLTSNVNKAIDSYKEDGYDIIYIKHILSKLMWGVGFSIKGTDISTKVLDKAVNAVYEMATVANIPIDIKKKYFLKSSDPQKTIVRIKPEIRNCCSFSRLNFMDQNYNISDTFQVIFCRNVLIYFDKQTQEAIIRKLLKHLELDGYLFLGHSETIFSMDLPLENVAPAVYRKIGSSKKL